jgi:hypothetical protein
MIQFLLEFVVRIFPVVHRKFFETIQIKTRVEELEVWANLLDRIQLEDHSTVVL